MAKLRRATTSRPSKKPAEPKKSAAAKKRSAAVETPCEAPSSVEAPKRRRTRAPKLEAVATALPAPPTPETLIENTSTESALPPPDSINWTELATLLSPRTRDRLQRAFALEDEAHRLGELRPAEPAPEPFIAFDPFAGDVSLDDPPFDEPAVKKEDWHTPDDVADAFEEPLALDVVSPPPLEPVKPNLSFHPNITPSSNPLYLERARRAAQEQAQAAEHVTLVDKVRQESRLVLSVAVGLAAPLLFFAGALALRGPTQGERAPLAPAQTSANPIAAASADGARDYALASEQLAEGRTREGVTLLRRSAQAGFAPAQYRLAKLYEAGEGVPRDLAVARAWTERAAEGGNCRAMHDLGVYFARGDGAPLDDAAAFRWFRQAAALGVADSQFNLGVLYQQGRGVSADPQEALFWYVLAARQGDADATDRAVDLASGLAPEQVARVRARARAFQPAAPDAVANGRGACITA